MMENHTPQQPVQESDATAASISLHDIIRMVIDNWYWFALSVVFCLCIAYYYLASTPKVYSRTATILVKDSRKGGDVELQAFSDLAGFQSRRNVDNEVYILQSRRLMEEVVKRLNLTTNYTVRERLRTRALYTQSPIDVQFVDNNDKLSCSMEITPLEGDKIRLTRFDDEFITKQESKQVLTAQYGDTIATPVGRIVVNKTLYMDEEKYLDEPIERVQMLAGGAAVHTFRNADKGMAAGVEIELRKTLVRDLRLGINGTYMYTNVKLPESGVYTNKERALQGASPYLLNADLTWTPRFGGERQLNLALLYNLQGPRIQAVGISGLGDVTQRPVHTLNFSAAYRFSARAELKMQLTDLLNRALVFEQEVPQTNRTVVVERYRRGTGFEIGLNLKF